MKRNCSDEKTVPAKRRPSGAAVLQTSVTDALHRALFEEWAETGYAALRMERIASRAGVGKAALYRRWKSKRELAFEAVNSSAIALTSIPDTGNFKDDIRAIMRHLAATLRHPLIRRILPDLHAERARSDELAELLEQVSKERRNQALAILQRALRRGELDEQTDPELALDMLIAPLYWGIVIQRRTMTYKDVDQLADQIASIWCR
ncbi:TetR/AcrR family transcriptional regulator [Marinobacterium jannaschii]|uniref:TetR/AcrR family transcriptional regulator n=1 Tax=Marinobacterium jannaschii TaxID=64970 RepID=UPI000484EBDD|nr:TetR/AcrR family transcriptional regulator [Marinobacterium jannaschii]